MDSTLKICSYLSCLKNNSIHLLLYLTFSFVNCSIRNQKTLLKYLLFHIFHEMAFMVTWSEDNYHYALFQSLGVWQFYTIGFQCFYSLGIQRERDELCTKWYRIGLKYYMYLTKLLESRDSCMWSKTKPI